MHGLEVFHARPIPSHGGSIRVYAARKGTRPVQASVKQMLDAEPKGDAMRKRLGAFEHDVMMSKLRLHALIRDVKEKGGRIVGISAPSRASTLFNYVGLDDGILDCVLEIKGSYKIGKYIPGNPNIIVQTLPGGGSMKSVQTTFAIAPKDGLAFTIAQRGMMMMTLLSFTFPFFLSISSFSSFFSVSAR